MVQEYVEAFLQMIAMLMIFLGTKYLTYNVTEVWGLPKWLNFKPWSCNTCLTFWSLVAIYTTLWIIGYKWLGISGLILALLNAIAMYINQRRKTVSVDEINNTEKE